MATIIKQFCLMHVAWAGIEVLCTPRAPQGYCTWGGCWGRSNSSSFRSPGATGLLSPRTISHRSLCWQQSTSPWQTGLGRCVMTWWLSDFPGLIILLFQLLSLWSLCSCSACLLGFRWCSVPDTYSLLLKCLATGQFRGCCWCCALLA